MSITNFMNEFVAELKKQMANDHECPLCGTELDGNFCHNGDGEIDDKTLHDLAEYEYEYQRSVPWGKC